jgi:glycosyltransferase involved in cell wall biosynthesis
MRVRRICFVGWADHVHLERWAGYFAAQGHEVSVISFSGMGHYPAGVRQYRVGLEGRGQRWVQWKLRWLLLRIRPEIVHVHWAHFATSVCAAWRGPLVVTAWGSDIYRRTQFDDEQWQGLKLALHRADLVTCDSNDLARTIHESFELPEQAVEVIQWGVDTEKFSPAGADQRHALGLDHREVIFSARNFTPLYNQETVVAAFAALRERRKGVFLLMKSYGGDPQYVARIRSEIDRLGLTDDTKILDTVPYEEMPALYRTADATISIPLSDAAPMSLFEAMASGSPCVVCDLPSLREWVDDGRTGFLAPATDVQAVAEALHQALEVGPQRERMRHQARELVVTRASQHVHMGVVAQHYQRLCN